MRTQSVVSLLAALLFAGCEIPDLRQSNTEKAREIYAQMEKVDQDIAARAGTASCSITAECRMVRYGSCGGIVRVFSTSTTSETEVNDRVTEYNRLKAEAQRYVHSSVCCMALAELDPPRCDDTGHCSVEAAH